MNFKYISTVKLTINDDELERYCESLNFDWNEFSKQVVEDKKYKNTDRLSGFLSNVFREFIGTKSEFLETQKGLFQIPYLGEHLTKSDVSFFYLETEFPFRIKPESYIKYDDGNVKKVSVDRLFHAVDFFVKQNGLKELEPFETEEFKSILSTLLKPEESMLLISDLKKWDEFFIFKPSFFDQISNSLNQTLDSISYPFSSNDTGNDVVVGETPNSNPSYFWGMMGELLTQGHSSLRIINLESSNDVETLHFERRIDLLYPDLGDSQRRRMIRGVHFDDDVFYWPNQEGDTNLRGDKYVLDLDEKTIHSPVFHTYDLLLNSTHSVTLTHFSGWPDGSIPFKPPTETITLSHFIMDVAKEKKDTKELLYIHCKSGLGRAGVFRVALEFAMDKLDGKPGLSVAKYVETFRSNYRYAVQTPEQFRYLHDLCSEIDTVIQSS